MRRLSLALMGLALACALPAMAQTATAAKAPAAPPAAPVRTLLSVSEVMRHIVNPAAETYWAHTGVIDDDKGSNDRTPTTQAGWDLTINAAAQVAEAGNLLMMDGRARDPGGPWMKYARALNAAGISGMAAASAKDHDKTFEVGGDIYDACFNCHAKYIQRPKNSLYKQGVEGAVPPR
jgi:hypothetical protein